MLCQGNDTSSVMRSQVFHIPAQEEEHSVCLLMYRM